MPANSSNTDVAILFSASGVAVWVEDLLSAKVTHKSSQSRVSLGHLGERTVAIGCPLPGQSLNAAFVQSVLAAHRPQSLIGAGYVQTADEVRGVFSIRSVKRSPEAQPIQLAHLQSQSGELTSIAVQTFAATNDHMAFAPWAGVLAEVSQPVRLPCLLFGMLQAAKDDRYRSVAHRLGTALATLLEGPQAVRRKSRELATAWEQKQQLSQAILTAVEHWPPALRSS